MTRGELWWADFGMPFGSESGYKRPVIIMQNNFFNDSRINTTVVVPLTTNLLLADAPGNILVFANDSGLERDSVVVVSQIEVIDRRRLFERITKIDGAIIEKVENGIMLVLGMQGR